MYISFSLFCITSLSLSLSLSPSLLSLSLSHARTRAHALYGDANVPGHITVEEVLHGSCSESILEGCKRT